MRPRPHGPAWLRLRCAILAAATSWLFVVVAVARPIAPKVTTDGDAQAGYVTVHWEGDDLGEFQVESSPDPDFASTRRIYQGTHRAKVLSGLPNGTRYFRVRGRQQSGGAWGPWSAAARFDVKHHSLLLATALFVVGAAVFAATTGFLIRMSGRADDA